jgi:hypothetical protein
MIKNSSNVCTRKEKTETKELDLSLRNKPEDEDLENTEDAVDDRKEVIGHAEKVEGPQ